MRGGASCAIGNKIYYFGGWCNHDYCLHNSLHELDTDRFKWSLCLVNSHNGPTEKSVCGMVAFHQTLLVVGGIVSPPKNPQPFAQYNNVRLPVQFARSNEHHLHSLGTGELRLVMTCAVCVCACWRVVCGWLIVEGWRMIEIVVAWKVRQFLVYMKLLVLCFS